MMPRCRIVDDDLECKAENWENFQILSIKGGESKVLNSIHEQTFLMNFRRDPWFYTIRNQWDE